jgi:ornithine cyclodeaminase/alanine dehydrogenase
MLILMDADVERLISMREAIDAVEEAFGEYAAGKALMPPRSTLMLERFGGSVSVMPSYLEGMKALATKIISIYPHNPERELPTTVAWVIVNDPETGKLLGLMEATYLTALRTGAVTGVAARYLAPRGSRVAALIGCGVQGRAQAWALTETCELDAIRLFDVSRERVRRFADEMDPKLGVDLTKTESGIDAVNGADVVVTATTSREPVIRRSWLGDEVHMSAVGSFYPDHRELDTDTIRQAKVIVDSREAAREEAGDIIIPLKEGAISNDHIYAELGELVLGRKRGRVEGDGLTVFKSVGLAIQDSSVAKIVLQKISKT